MKKYIAVLVALLMAVTFIGCKKDAAQVGVISSASSAVQPLVTTAQPETAIDKIYEAIPTRDMLSASDNELEELFSIDPANLKDYYVNFTSGKYGLVNVFILQPADRDNENDKEELNAKIKEELNLVKDKLAAQFEHYDIYNATGIAKDAVIFDQGGYIIMLMLEDTETARNIIDQYIPKS